MTEDQAPDLYECMTRLRWQSPLLALLLVLLNQIMEQTWLAHLPRWQHSTTQVLYYGLIGPSFAWWALTSKRSRIREADKAIFADIRTRKKIGISN